VVPATSVACALPLIYCRGAASVAWCFAADLSPGSRQRGGFTGCYLGGGAGVAWCFAADLSPGSRQRGVVLC